MTSDFFSPSVIATWGFNESVDSSWNILSKGCCAVDACVEGCRVCQNSDTGGSVGWGGSPNENGETTLDAMIMDGKTLRVGCVGSLPSIKDAIGVSYDIMTCTKHSMLVGSEARDFAIKLGYPEESLTSEVSSKQWKDWKNNGCIPNYWIGDRFSHTCKKEQPLQENQKVSGSFGHDTIGIVAIDMNGDMAAATSTNGKKFKIPGRVGDSPIPGSGCYVNSKYGGAAATGDGDILMRFLPSYKIVDLLKDGYNANDACDTVIRLILEYEPFFTGGVVALTPKGEYGASCYGFTDYKYTYQSVGTGIIINDVNPVK